MPLFARLVFGMVDWAARKGLAHDSTVEPPAPAPADKSAKLKARATGIRGETFAYWYLRRHGYVMIARNYSTPGMKGELDLVGYDGPVLAFIEVKTRTGEDAGFGKPEDAVTPDKQRIIGRMAQRFLLDRRVPQGTYRFDILAVESQPGRRPVVRLHKNAFAG